MQLHRRRRRPVPAGRRRSALGEWWNLRGGPLLFYYAGAGAGRRRPLLIGAAASARRLGYQWLAVREDQQAARALGIDVFRAKMTAVLISSGMTAVGGVFYGFYYNNLFPAQVFDIGRSIELILAPIVGGLGTVFGPVVGAFILTPLGEALTALTQRLGINAPGAKALFYGLTLMAIIFVAPERRVAVAGARCLALDRTRPNDRRCLSVDGVSKRFRGLLRSAG